jgi:hypothetical protein
VTPTIVLSLVKYGLLALLWIFILAAVRVVKADLFGSTPKSAPRPAAAPAAVPGPAAARRRSQARRLVVTEGALAGTSIDLGDRPVTLGRADESTLVLTDDYASNHHARLVPGDGMWLVEDLGSTNGTYLGKERVTSPVPVPMGAQIRIGKTVLELRR